MKQRHYYLAFIVYVFISFNAQAFILNRILGDGLGTGLITLFLFSLGLGNSLFYLLFLPAKGKIEPKIVRFFILFLPGFYLISSLLGGGPTFFSIRLALNSIKRIGLRNLNGSKKNADRSAGV